jgi:hypothetical protein
MGGEERREEKIMKHGRGDGGDAILRPVSLERARSLSTSIQQVSNSAFLLPNYVLDLVLFLGWFYIRVRSVGGLLDKRQLPYILDLEDTLQEF